MADLLCNGAERCAGPDRLELLMVADKDDLRPTCLGLVDEPGELPASHHVRLIDHEHIAAAQIVSVVLPTAGPGRQRTALDAGTFLKPLGRLARQRRAMNRITLRLSRLARRRQHRTLASPGETDDSRNPVPPGDVLNRPPLLV